MTEEERIHKGDLEFAHLVADSAQKRIRGIEGLEEFGDSVRLHTLWRVWKDGKNVLLVSLYGMWGGKRFIAFPESCGRFTETEAVIAGHMQGEELIQAIGI